MGEVTVGVVRERAPRERRVALVPDSVGRLCSIGVGVLVEGGAGIGAWFTDGAYEAAGATVVSAGELCAHADVLLCVQPPGEHLALRAGQVVLGLLEPLTRLDLVRRFTEQGVTAVSLDMLPRTLSRAQSMDALTSQANIAGYKAVLLAADTYGRYLPMLTTAAGTFKPAQVLGGNVEVPGRMPDGITVLAGGVTVLDGDDLPSRMAPAASTAYARNVVALLTQLVRDGQLVVDLADEVQSGVVITHGGVVVNPVVAAALGGLGPVAA